MNTKAELQKVSSETMRFMRGTYSLDEVPGKYYDVDCLKFRPWKRHITSGFAELSLTDRLAQLRSHGCCASANATAPSGPPLCDIYPAAVVY